MQTHNTLFLGAITALLAGVGCLGNIGLDGSSTTQSDEALGGSGGSLGAGGSLNPGVGGEAPPPGDPPPDDPPPDDPGGGGAGGTEAPPVDCSGIAQHPAYELCDQSATHCAGVFTNSAGCAAYCAAAGLQCTASYGGDAGCQKETTPLDCNANTGHQSDWCECGPSTAPPSNCPTDPQNPPATVEQHYTQATFAPRSSWVLTCTNYAYTAQYAEHEACDSLYSAGSGQGTATFLLNVNPGQYDVYIEGRHTDNRNPAGMRVEVNNGTLTQVIYIMQKDNSGQIKMDLHGTYCLDGQVEVIVDSSVSNASDSVSRVRIQPS
ncbi:MAG: hypothetical protein DRI90_00380 [Deltaproteobacteria bacterium]|nr:MAG: hypothetical protein DRI90_00380 [Deltaproteobacteria bacterium]